LGHNPYSDIGHYDQLWGEIMTETALRWTAIVLAGQRPGVDPLAAHFGTDLKALVEIDCEAMITHVVRTLSRVPEISKIIVLAQSPDRLRSAVAPLSDKIVLAESGAGISSSIQMLAGGEAAPWPVLVTTADHPLLTPEMVRAFIAEAQGADVAVAMVERAVMLAQFPDAARTWIKLADGAWSGANLFALCTNRAGAALDLWATAERDRKVAWRLFLHFGPLLALRALTRTVGMARGLQIAGRRLGLTAKLVPMADPVAAIDVDKPLDHALASAILQARKHTTL
jgi:GTP:adenosylcobinamide-phosphate guanylyltransferase